MDKLAMENNLDVIAQIGRSSYKPEFIKYFSSLSPRDFSLYFAKAELIVAHAGIGTILSAKKMKKRLIVFPRSVELGEHRNNHQIATAVQIKNRAGIYVAENEQELCDLVMKRNKLLPASLHNEGEGKKELVAYLADFINKGNAK